MFAFASQIQRSPIDACPVSIVSVARALCPPNVDQSILLATMMISSTGAVDVDLASGRSKVCRLFLNRNDHLLINLLI